MTLTFKDLGYNKPIKTADGKLGLVILFRDGCGIVSDKVGVQVPGEEDVRWIPIDRLNLGGGALKEVAQ